MADEATVERAGDALYRAFKVFEEAPTGDIDLQGADYRTFFIHALRTAAVYVAEADGRLSRNESVTIEHVFYLDAGSADAISEELADDPALAKAAVDQLRAITHDMAAFQQAMGRDVSIEADPLVHASHRLFRAVLAADPGNDPHNERYTATMASLREAAVVGAAAPLPVALPAPAAEPLASLPVVDCPARLRDGELCRAITAATLFQESNVVSRVRHAGLSSHVRIARGLSFKAGSYGVDRLRSPKVERIATGTLCITDQRLVFLSDVKNLDLPYARLLSTTTGPGTIEVGRPNAGRLLFHETDESAVELFEQVSGTSLERRLLLERARSTGDSRPAPVNPALFVVIAVLIVAAVIFIYARSRGL